MSMPSLPSTHTQHPARHVFSKVGLALFTAVIVGSFVFSSFYIQAFIQSGQLAAVISATLVDLANNDRKQDAIGPLTVNPKLVAAAQAKANDMAEKGYFAHTSPDGSTSWSWFEKAGYSFLYAGENLAVNFKDSKDVEEAWMNSPTHRANILNSKFTEIGIATAEGEYKGKKTIFVVQMFGTPKEGAGIARVEEATNPQNPQELAVATTEEASATVVLGSSAPAPEPIAAVTEQDEPIGALRADVSPYTNIFGFLVSSPQNMLRTIYVLCALVVLLALALVTQMEFKRHHFRHMAAAVFLLALMGGLFTVADFYVFQPPIIGGGESVPLGVVEPPSFV